jgi:hypothetical protein
MVLTFTGHTFPLSVTDSLKKWFFNGIDVQDNLFLSVNV